MGWEGPWGWEWAGLWGGYEADAGGDTATTLPRTFTVVVGTPSAADFTVEVTP